MPTRRALLAPLLVLALLLLLLLALVPGAVRGARAAALTPSYATRLEFNATDPGLDSVSGSHAQLLGSLRVLSTGVLDLYGRSVVDLANRPSHDPVLIGSKGTWMRSTDQFLGQIDRAWMITYH